MRLNKSFIDKTAIPLPSPNGRATQKFYRDDAIPGFALRVTSGGSKSFIVEKRINGRNKRHTIGKYGHLTVEQARKQAIAFLGEVAVGKDPVRERAAQKACVVTLVEAFEDYLLTRKTLKPDTVKDYRRSIEMYLKTWLAKPLSDITKDMVEIRHRKIGQRSHARANNAMRVLRAVFNHAMGKYEDAQGNPTILFNPVDRLSRNRAWYKIERRRTYIKAHQLADWFDATGQLMNETTRDYLHFLLFTGLRRSEAAKLEWINVDFNDRTFTIPDTKNGLPHTLPFSNFLEEMLQRRFEHSQSDYIFDSNSARGYLTEPKFSMARVTDLSGVEFALHDLRRTFITHAEGLDIPAYALKRLLNHKDPNDVTAGYIVSDVSRLRKPMQAITDFLLRAIESGGTAEIIPLRIAP